MLLSDIEIVEYATEEASKLEIADAALAERASRFYSILSSAAVAGDVVLTGKMEYAYRDAFFDRPALPYDRLDLTEKYLCDRLAHYIDGNSLEVNPPYETEADKLLDDLFTSDRFERARNEAKIVWKDVRLSLRHARLVLDRFEVCVPTWWGG